MRILNDDGRMPMLKTVVGVCRNCNKPIPEDADPRRKYCSVPCKQTFNRRLKQEEKKAAVKQRRKELAVMADAREKNMVSGGDDMVKEFRARAFDKIEDEVRDVMRDEIRKAITQLVRDKALGAANVLVEMLPEAMARIQQDLDSSDTIARRAATALVMKYAMPMLQTEDNTGSGTTVIVHSIPRSGEFIDAEPAEFEVAVVPEGGETFEEAVERYAHEKLEEFEQDWPICYRCKQVTHPDNIRNGIPAGPICKSCDIRRRIEAGQSPAELSNNPLYG